MRCDRDPWGQCERPREARAPPRSTASRLPAREEWRAADVAQARPVKLRPEQESYFARSRNTGSNPPEDHPRRATSARAKERGGVGPPRTGTRETTAQRARA